MAARAPRKRTTEEEPPPEDDMGYQGGYVPIDNDAEIAVMAAILTSPDAYFDVSTLLDPEDFGVAALAEVYRAVMTCDAAGKPFDVITVADELKRSKSLTKVGGIEGLNRLVDRASSVSNVVAHAEIVAEKALLRRLVTAGRSITSNAMDVEMHAKDALATAESTVFELGKQKGASSLVEMPQAVAHMLDELSRTRTSLLVGHSTGFKELDRMTAGFQGGQLIVLAARPGAGKSAFALQLARNIAESSGLLVPFLSYEMSTNELTMRMLSGALEHDLPKLRSGDIPSGMERDLAREAERMAELPVMIDDNPPETIGGVRSQMRRIARRGQVGAVVVDYLQLMSGDRVSKDANRTQEVSDISRGLKRLATELDIPVIALSQLNRSLENRPNKRPMLSDLRESGCLAPDVRVLRADTNTEITIGEIFNQGLTNIPVWSTDEDNNMVVSTMTHAFASGRKMTYRLSTSNGHQVEATGNHPFLTQGGWVVLDDLKTGCRVGVSSSTRDLHWDTVVSIDAVEEKEVYDATVLGTHNFVANGVVVHNSIEQDASLVLFLYRESLYNAAADPTLAECIVGKQRNGPQGTIHLDFLGACAKFKDTDRRPEAPGAPAGPSAGGTFSTANKNAF